MNTFELDRPAPLAAAGHLVDLDATAGHSDAGDEDAGHPDAGAAFDADPEQEVLAGLLRSTAQGDPDSFTDFYRRTSARVHGLVRRVLVDPGLSEEVTQEIFLGVWQDAGKFDHALGSPLGWLMTIAHRRAVDRVRSYQSSTNRDERWASASHVVAHDEVAETVAGRIESRALLASISALPALQRESIALAYFGCLTYREVAERLAAPLPTVKSRIRDGLRLLRVELETA
ncbi:ECF RNA polymerase sigma factor SigK [Arthrobacter sp. CG_A4]|uniref:ECF RNA polymerase sigma factor SigK n=1 Tax=Arthrobacter sp. CG_A4 TaxID=3071706 RepID=UPI002E07A088|nr:RNA polymerase sigma-70 factor (ECF subfamily) [Arthrobacter sp. CG_A4]